MRDRRGLLDRGAYSSTEATVRRFSLSRGERAKGEGILIKI